MRQSEILYHGTYRLFDEFSTSFSGSGEGHSKFGQGGIYITSSYKTAARYAAKAAKKNGEGNFYVYTIDVPVLTDNNHIFSNKPVNKEIVSRTEAALGETIPDTATILGKHFRKYLGNLLTGQRNTIKKMTEKANDEAEIAATTFLRTIDIVYLAWPQAQTKPDGVTNRLALNATDIKILKIEQVEVNDKNDLIDNSQKIIKEYGFF